MGNLIAGCRYHFRAIDAQLNQSGYRTRTGMAFHPLGMQRLLPKPSE